MITSNTKYPFGGKVATVETKSFNCMISTAKDGIFKNWDRFASGRETDAGFSTRVTAQVARADGTATAGACGRGRRLDVRLDHIAVTQSAQLGAGVAGWWESNSSFMIGKPADRLILNDPAPVPWPAWTWSPCLTGFRPRCRSRRKRWRCPFSWTR